MNKLRPQSKKILDGIKNLVGLIWGKKNFLREKACHKTLLISLFILSSEFLLQIMKFCVLASTPRFFAENVATLHNREFAYCHVISGLESVESM